uniref:Reverse transcriptase domain-containing protein n=1 Tax=Tanacetum cinerariifolium TaxID=118510 RepID=A0A699TST0_TANCI|nr:hypothetical protein [Tanacetum cinerariifolium]
MAPRRTTRSTADQETVNATTVTNAQLQIMIDQGVTATLAARDALRRRSELFVNAPTPNFLNVNHYLSQAPKEFPVFRNGVKE